MAGERWLFTKSQLTTTASHKSGIDSEKELSYRQQAANFIQDMGQRLQVTQLCINTAIVYMHRFFVFHSFSKFHRNSISTASLFLAAKVEEQPRKLEHVIKVGHLCLHRDAPALNTESEAYLEQAQELVVNESILLQTLGFEITVDHPHTHVVKTCQLVRASKDLAQTSYFLATNSLHLTTMCLQVRPTVVACVCIHLACKWSNFQIPRSSEGQDWFKYVDKGATVEILEELTQDFLNILDNCPSRLKKKILMWKVRCSSEENQGGLRKTGRGSELKDDDQPPLEKRQKRDISQQSLRNKAHVSDSVDVGTGSLPSSRSSSSIGKPITTHSSAKSELLLKSASSHTLHKLDSSHAQDRVPPLPEVLQNLDEINASSTPSSQHAAALKSEEQRKTPTKYKDYVERKAREKLASSSAESVGPSPVKSSSGHNAGRVSIDGTGQPVPGRQHSGHQLSQSKISADLINVSSHSTTIPASHKHLNRSESSDDFLLTTSDNILVLNSASSDPSNAKKEHRSRLSESDERRHRLSAESIRRHKANQARIDAVHQLDTQHKAHDLSIDHSLSASQGRASDGHHHHHHHHQAHVKGEDGHARTQVRPDESHSKTHSKLKESHSRTHIKPEDSSLLRTHVKAEDNKTRTHTKSESVHSRVHVKLEDGHPSGQLQADEHLSKQQIRSAEHGHSRSHVNLDDSDSKPPVSSENNSAKQHLKQEHSLSKIHTELDVSQSSQHSGINDIDPATPVQFENKNNSTKLHRKQDENPLRTDSNRDAIQPTLNVKSESDHSRTHAKQEGIVPKPAAYKTVDESQLRDLGITVKIEQTSPPKDANANDNEQLLASKLTEMINPLSIKLGKEPVILEPGELPPESPEDSGLAKIVLRVKKEPVTPELQSFVAEVKRESPLINTNSKTCSPYPGVELKRESPFTTSEQKLDSPHSLKLVLKTTPKKQESSDNCSQVIQKLDSPHSLKMVLKTTPRKQESSDNGSQLSHSSRSSSQEKIRHHHRHHHKDPKKQSVLKEREKHHMKESSGISHKTNNPPLKLKLSLSSTPDGTKVTVDSSPSKHKHSSTSSRMSKHKHGSHGQEHHGHHRHRPNSGSSHDKNTATAGTSKSTSILPENVHNKKSQPIVTLKSLSNTTEYSRRHAEKMKTNPHDSGTGLRHQLTDRTSEQASQQHSFPNLPVSAIPDILGHNAISRQSQKEYVSDFSSLGLTIGSMPPSQRNLKRPPSPHTLSQTSTPYKQLRRGPSSSHLSTLSQSASDTELALQSVHGIRTDGSVSDSNLIMKKHSTNGSVSDSSGSPASILAGIPQAELSQIQLNVQKLIDLQKSVIAASQHKKPRTPSQGSRQEVAAATNATTSHRHGYHQQQQAYHQQQQQHYQLQQPQQHQNFNTFSMNQDPSQIYESDYIPDFSSPPMTNAAMNSPHPPPLPRIPHPDSLPPPPPPPPSF